MKDYMPYAQDLLVNYRTKIVMGIISKSLTARFNFKFCFGVSDEDPIKSAVRLAKLGRKSLVLS